jgi:hypothetical protein
VARGAQRRRLNRAKWRDLEGVGRSFAEAAELAAEFEYWNAAGVLIVHAGIALADAIAVRLTGTKNSGDDHVQAAALLQEVVVGDQESSRAIRQLRAILQEKTRVSYSGEVYSAADVARLRKHFNRFRRWAETLLLP